MPENETNEKQEALRQANPTDIVGSVDTRGIHSRYDSPAKVAPLLDFYPEGDERDLGVTEDGEYEVMASTEPGDVEARELEAYRAGLQAESVASVIGGPSHPYSKGHEETKDPVVHDLLNPKEGGRALEQGPDPDAQPVSIEGEDDDRPARESAAAEAGRAITEGNPKDILRAEGSEGHTVSTGLDDPKEQSTPRGERDEAPDDVVIDVTSEASGPDGVVEGSDAEESIERAREERQEGEGGTVVDESGNENVPAQSDGEVPESDDDDDDVEGLPEGWESDWTNDQMYAFAQEHDIKSVNSGSKKAELISALKEWEQG